MLRRLRKLIPFLFAIIAPSLENHTEPKRRQNDITDYFNVTKIKNHRHVFDETFLHPKKHQRFITFEAESGDIEVNLEFSIPFLELPVKDLRKNFYQGLPLAKINSASAVLGGSIILGLFILIPALVSVAPPSTVQHVFSGILGGHGPGFHRALDSETNEIWKVISSLEETLSQNGIDSTTCMQRVLCDVIQQSADRVKSNAAVSSDKLIDGLASNGMVKRFIQQTTIEDAIESGYKNENCGAKYSACRLPTFIFKKILELIGGGGK